MKPEDIAKRITEDPDVIQGMPDLVVPYTLFDDDDYEVAVSVGGDLDDTMLQDILFAKEKRTGRLLDGDEFASLNAAEGIDYIGQLEDRINEYYADAGMIDDVDAYKRTKEDELLGRHGY